MSLWKLLVTLVPPVLVWWQDRLTYRSNGSISIYTMFILNYLRCIYGYDKNKIATSENILPMR
jgi:hypothetical protein